MFSQKWLVVHVFVLVLAMFSTTTLAEETLCATVQLDIPQEFSFERQAFEAKMRITNTRDNFPLDQFKITLNFANDEGVETQFSSSTDAEQNAGAEFFVDLKSNNGVSAIDGSSSLAVNQSADIRWLMIPAASAAGESKLGKRYFIGATVSYSYNGKTQSIDVAPDTIVVAPPPLLELDYFLPETVIGDDALTSEIIEPSEPYSFVARLNNLGLGDASNFRLSEPIPVILSNDQFLPIEFKVLKGFVDDLADEAALDLSFGELPGESIRTASWLMQSPVAGNFLGFSAKVSHSTALGGALTSLFSVNDPHTLVEYVWVDLPGRDFVSDILAIDTVIDAEGAETEHLRVYESEPNGVVNEACKSCLDVTRVTDALLGAEQERAGGVIDRALSSSVTSGLSLIKITDPYLGKKLLTKVLRNDGKPLSEQNFWFSKTRAKGESEYQYWLNIFDVDLTDRYTLTFGRLSDLPHAPEIQYVSDRETYEGSQVGFAIRSYDVNGSIPALYAEALPEGAKFTVQGNGKALFTWFPQIGQAGTYPISFIATDGMFDTTQTVTVQVNPADDIDGDGLKDTWEIQYFGHLDRDGSGDYDKDGFADLEEHTHGTPPNLAARMPGNPEIKAPFYGEEITSLKPNLSVINGEHDADLVVTYSFEVYANESMTDLVIQKSGVPTGNVETELTLSADLFVGGEIQLADNHHYFWRARAITFDNSLEVASPWANGRFFANSLNDAPATLHISAPLDNAVVSTIRPNLFVSNSFDIDEDDLNYSFEVYADQAASQIVASVNNIVPGPLGDTRWQLPIDLNDENATYYWRAIVTDQHGVSTESDLSSFVVSLENDAPSEPILYSPIQGTEANTQAIPLTVFNAQDPESQSLVYRFEVDKQNTFNTVEHILSGDIEELLYYTTWTTNYFEDNTRYFWRAQSHDGVVSSAWEQGNFFVNLSNDAPSVPTVNNPGHDSLVQTSRPRLIANTSSDIDGDDIAYRFEVYADAALSQLLATRVSSQPHWQVDVSLDDYAHYYWRVQSEDEHGLASDWTSANHFFVNLTGTNKEPSLEFVLPNENIQAVGGYVSLRWTDSDPDDSASISLMANGQLIASNIEEDLDGDGDSYSWFIGDLEPGEYQISAFIRDETNTISALACCTFTKLAEESGIVITNETQMITNEDGTTIAEASVVLSGALAADTELEIRVTSGDINEGVILDAQGNSGIDTTLRFTPENWYEPQYIRIKGVGDCVLDGEVSYRVDMQVVNSTDPAYQGIQLGNLHIINLDRDEFSPDFFVCGFQNVSQTPLTVENETWVDHEVRALLHNRGDALSSVSSSITETFSQVEIQSGGNLSFPFVMSGRTVESYETVTLRLPAGQVLKPELMVWSMIAGDVAPVTIGGNGDDILTGSDDFDVIDGAEGHDVINAGAGNDIIIGGIGRDTINAGEGDDTIIVTGNDAYEDTVNGGEGFDRILGDETDDTIRLSDFSGENTVEQIDGGEGYDVIEGLNDNDNLDFSGTGIINIEKIDGRSGDDTITGSAGNDVIVGGAGSDTLHGGAGNDQFLIDGEQTDSDRIFGGAGNDSIIGGEGNDVIKLAELSGIEKIDGGEGVNSLVGTEGNDTFNLSSVELSNIKLIQGLAGNDTITGTVMDDVIEGGAGDDQLDGLAGNDTFIFNGLNTGLDTINGGDGKDTLLGGVHDDLISLSVFSISNSIEEIDGNGGFNSIQATLGADNFDFSKTLLTGINEIDLLDGDDVIIGSSDNDNIVGGAGNDSLTGGSGNDTYIFKTFGSPLGSDGNDTIHETISFEETDRVAFSNITSVDDIIFELQGNDLSIQSVHATESGSVLLPNWLKGNHEQFLLVLKDNIVLSMKDQVAIEITHEGTELNNYLNGTAELDKMFGKEGNDTLKGLGGDDFLWGEAGNDILNGGSGADRLEGGDGDDYIFGYHQKDGALCYDYYQDGYSANILIGGAGNDVLCGVRGADLLEGGEGDDALNGMWGNDTLRGGAGNDTLVGDRGRDYLFGGEGNDTLTGGDDIDELSGGPGNDILSGGAGKDIYLFNLGDGKDTITATNGEILKFGEGIQAEDLSYIPGKELIIVINANDQITVNTWSSSNSIFLQWSDGSQAKLSDLVEVAVPQWEHSATESATGFDGIDIVTPMTVVKSSVTIHTYGGNDQVTGSDSRETVYAGDGDDLVYGYGADDRLYGNNGLDRLEGGDGNDILKGGNDDDYLDGGAGNDSLYGEAGTDELHGGSGDDLLIGDHSKPSTNNYSTGNDTLYGEAGNDELWGGQGNNLLFGGEGNDALNGEMGADVLSGGVGNDTLNGGEGNDTYQFNIGDGNDEIADFYSGTYAYIAIKQGSETIQFGEGISQSSLSFMASLNDLIITFGESSDRLVVKEWLTVNNYTNNRTRFSVKWFDGSTLNLDSIVGNLVNYIEGDQGDNVLNGFSLEDSLNGGPGNDTLNGLAGNDELYGGTGNDILNGGSGSDIYHFSEGGGSDTINDSGSTEIIKFGPNISITDINFLPVDVNESYISTINDLVIAIGSSGDRLIIRNWLNYGKGKFTLVFENNSSSTILNLLLNSPTGLQRIGSVASEYINGFEGIDTIHGGAGNDQLNGLDANDFLWGEAGNDILNGGSGADRLEGGDGDDYIFGYHQKDGALCYDYYQDGYSANILIGGAGNDVLCGVRGADLLEGGEGDDALNGMWGNDTLRGGAGNDTLVGDRGRDYLFGGEGNDTLTGGDDIDELSGGPGNDILSGGAGKDIYLFNLGDGKDTITATNGEILKFGEGIQAEDLSYIPGKELIIVINANDQITVNTWSSSNSIFLQWSDGSQAKLSDLVEVAVPQWEHSATESATGFDGIDIVTPMTVVKSSVTIHTYGGNDQVTGSDSRETVYAGDGDDLVYGYGADDRLYGNNGLDRLEGGDGNDILKGGNDDDYLDGGAGNDSLYGEAGTDELHGGSGDDLLIGDHSKPSTNNYSTGNDTLYGEAGNDELWGGQGNNLLFGGEGNDALNGEMGADVLSGGVGNDTLNGGEGNDTYQFNIGDGNDEIADFYSGTYAYIAIKQGSETIQFGEGISLNSLSFTLSLNDLVISFSNSSDTLVVRDWLKDNSIVHNRQRFSVQWHDGSQENLDVVVGNLVSIFMGDSTSENLVGTDGKDIIAGDAGDDTINSGNGNDQLIGGTGNDILIGGSGSDIYEFARGYGQDIVSDEIPALEVISFGEAISLGDLTIQVINNVDVQIGIAGTQDHITVTGWLRSAYVQGQYSVLFNDGTKIQLAELVLDKIPEMIRNGTENIDIFYGYDGRDVISSFSGDDILYGYAGNDQLNGGSGDDQLHGGIGEDILSGGIGFDELFGEEGDDSLHGNDGDDVLNGGAGNDTLVGGEGVDTLNGDEGVDSLSGGLGADNLNGNQGDDWLHGGGDQDTLNGGAGNDTYHFDINDGQDQIVDSSRDPSSGSGSELGIETIEFGEGISQAELIFNFVGTDVIISLPTLGNTTVTVVDWLWPENTDRFDILFDSGVRKHFAQVVYENMPEYTRSGTSNSDLIYGYIGRDSIYAGAGNDTIYGKESDDIIYGEDGSDSLYGGNGFDELHGGDGNDTLIGEEGDDILHGNLGNDFMTGGEGFDEIHGGMGDDKLYGLQDDDYLYGEDGADLILGGLGNDVIKGGAGDDSLKGEAGNDDLYGETGMDTLEGGAGDDNYFFNKGDGLDTIIDIEGTEYIVFGDQILESDVVYSYVGDDLQIDFVGYSDRLVISNMVNMDLSRFNLVFTSNNVQAP